MSIMCVRARGLYILPRLYHTAFRVTMTPLSHASERVDDVVYNSSPSIELKVCMLLLLLRG
jgi:hypothetical protein